MFFFLDLTILILGMCLCCIFDVTFALFLHVLFLHYWHIFLFIQVLVDVMYSTF